MLSLQDRFSPLQKDLGQPLTQNRWVLLGSREGFFSHCRTSGKLAAGPRTPSRAFPPPRGHAPCSKHLGFYP